MEIYPKMTKDNTALVVIDPINSCAHEDCETPEWNVHFSKIRKMLPKLDKFIKKYRQKIGGLVVITKTTPWNEKHLAKNINELYTDPMACYYSDDDSGFDEEFFVIKPEPSDLIFTKNTYDTFVGGELTKKLKDKGIKYIIMTGIFTDGCVLASIASGFSQGFNFVILKDLIETTDSPARQKIQKLLIENTFPKLYGKTIKSSELFENNNLIT
ncbi:MAG: isochorismatase family cysteine hydrolase [Candidatus Shapirobacteria bacterium]